MNHRTARRWLLPGALVVITSLGTACGDWGGSWYQGNSNEAQPLSSFGPGTGGSGPNIAPVQDRVGENLPPTAVNNVPPRVQPGIAQGDPDAIRREEEKEARQDREEAKDSAPARAPAQTPPPDNTH
ncbi:hypothetical protein VZQ01_25030 [Myxococcus faecalis]|jgi:hypothetical protein|uniref:hypothetical protein n=1 Tax=Myxococcus TaxID=32 RepID=UPI001CC044C4|nr:hypothetical protein [Myxococcus sp. AS-1-15]MBZ4396260.1 hypothetical protein [Myxococcus sp. AS-1-15]BDT37770.1 hypothetical protein MFMH1_74390 [Myxococcus sp. MH1]